MKKYINWFAYLTLISAFVFGYFGRNNDEGLSELELLTEKHLQLGEGDTDIYPLQDEKGLVGYLAKGEAQGYGGPLRVVVVADTSGTIIGTELVKSFETVSFLAKLENNKYYDQYNLKHVNDRFELKSDLEAVSGATVSSLAIANATREASYKIAERKLHVEVPRVEKKWRFGRKEGITFLIFLIGVVASFWKFKKLKYVSLFLGFVFIGFLFNASLSLTHLGRTFLGYFPDIHTHFVWWLLMAGTLTIVIVWGKNVYCNTMCPFRATQMILNKISGINLKLPAKLSKTLAQTPYVLLWFSLVIIFISANPTMASYEPFAMMFSLKGVGLQWYILPASLIGALFFSNFFCRFFCPVGGSLRWMLKVRKQVIGAVSNKKSN
jgi:hypothetical protein